MVLNLFFCVFHDWTAQNCLQKGLAKISSLETLEPGAWLSTKQVEMKTFHHYMRRALWREVSRYDWSLLNSECRAHLLGNKQVVGQPSCKSNRAPPISRLRKDLVSWPPHHTEMQACGWHLLRSQRKEKIVLLEPSMWKSDSTLLELSTVHLFARWICWTASSANKMTLSLDGFKRAMSGLHLNKLYCDWKASRSNSMRRWILTLQIGDEEQPVLQCERILDIFLKVNQNKKTWLMFSTHT